MSVFRFDPGALVRDLSVPGLAFFDEDMLSTATEGPAHYAVMRNQPIVLDDRWDIDECLTGFAAMITRTERSELTALTYAREAEVFSRYLGQVRGKDLSRLSEEDLWHYRSARLKGDLAFRLAPSSWNKVAASLIRLLRYLRLDFPDLHWRAFRASVEDANRVRMIGVPDYLRFRDDGMKAKRNPLRNAAFADLLVTTGVRCTEGALLLKHELPERRKFGTNKSILVELPATITKGEKRRSIICSKRLVTDLIDPYVSEERSHLVHGALDRLFAKRTHSVSSLEQFTDHIFFARESLSKVRIIAGNAAKALVPMSKLSPRERKMLIEVEPIGTAGQYSIVDFGYLWVSETGSNVSNQAWLSNFSGACEAVGPEKTPDLHVTPHVLRHTFAVHHLSNMLKGLLALRAERGRLDRRGEVFDRIVGDPLRHLQQLLGHRQIQTTYKYLTYVEDNHELVARATEQWDSLLDVRH